MYIIYIYIYLKSLKVEILGGATSPSVVDPAMLETQIPVYDEEDLEPRLHWQFCKPETEQEPN